MVNLVYNTDKTEHFRGHDVAPGSMETPQAVDSPMAAPATITVDAKTGKGEDPISARERQLEVWMDEVKQFIRGIDVNNL